jgi:hypothetical protein
VEELPQLLVVRVVVVVDLVLLVALELPPQ